MCLHLRLDQLEYVQGPTDTFKEVFGRVLARNYAINRNIGEKDENLWNDGSLYALKPVDNIPNSKGINIGGYIEYRYDRYNDYFELETAVVVQIVLIIGLMCFGIGCLAGFIFAKYYRPKHNDEKHSYVSM